MRTLSDPDTRLARLVQETGDAARIVAPLSDDLAARLHRRWPTRSRRASRDPRGAEGHDRALAGDARRGHPLAARHAPVPQPPRGPLRRGPGHRARAAREPAGGQQRARRRHAGAAPHAAVHRRPRGHAARAARPRRARRRPTPSLAGLTDTMKTLNPTLRYLGPHVTVCNYFTYMWTFIADHFSEEDATGTAAARPGQDRAARAGRTRCMSFGAVRPADGRHDRPGPARGVRRRRRAAPVRLPARGRRERQRRLRVRPARLPRRGDLHQPPHAGQPGPDVQGPPARARGPVLLRRADRHRALGAAMRRERGPSPFAVGATLLVLAVIVTYLVVRQGRPVRQRALRDQGRVPRHAPASSRTRPCGSRASRSAR